MLLNGNTYSSLPRDRQEAVRGIIAGCARWARDNNAPLSGVLMSCIANAAGESSFNRFAVGDKGAAVGLYQFNNGTPSALGSVLRRAGWTTANLQDPYDGTAGILWAASKSERWRAAVRSGSIRDCIIIFCTDAERPRDALAEGIRRADTHGAAWLHDSRWLNLACNDVERRAWPTSNPLTS